MVAAMVAGAVMPVRVSGIRPTQPAARASARSAFGLKRTSALRTVRVMAGEASAGTAAGKWVIHVTLQNEV